MMGMGSEIQRTPQMAHADPTWSPFDLHKQRLMKSFIGPRSGHCLVSRLLETWLMWPWHVKIHATSPKVTQPLQKSHNLTLPCLQNFVKPNELLKSDPSFEDLRCQKKIKAILLMLVFIDHCLVLSVHPPVSFSCCWDFIDVTLACEDLRDLSKSHATSPCLTSCCQVLTVMLLTWEHKQRLMKLDFHQTQVRSLPCLVTESVV